MIDDHIIALVEVAINDEDKSKLVQIIHNEEQAFAMLKIKYGDFQYLLYFENTSRGFHRRYKVIENWKQEVCDKKINCKKIYYKKVRVCNCEDGAKYLDENKI